MKNSAIVDFIRNLVVLMRVFSFCCGGGGRIKPVNATKL
jgi:hypothetical protein